MKRRYLNLLIDLLWDSPMWAFLIMGMVLVAASVLVGPWLENRRIAWQCELVQAQADRLAQQEQAYRQFQAALQRNDPALIERLAFHYLHLKPQGTDLLLQAGYRAGHGGRAVRLVAEHPGTVDRWAYRPMPVVGKDFPKYSAVDNLLVRVTTGPLHLVLVVLAGACILLGMIPLAQIARKPPHLPVIEPPPANRPNTFHGAVLLPSGEPQAGAVPPAGAAPPAEPDAVPVAVLATPSVAIPADAPLPAVPSISATAYTDAAEAAPVALSVAAQEAAPSDPQTGAADELLAEPDEAMDEAPPAAPAQGSLF